MRASHNVVNTEYPAFSNARLKLEGLLRGHSNELEVRQQEDHMFIRGSMSLKLRANQVATGIGSDTTTMDPFLPHCLPSLPHRVRVKVYVQINHMPQSGTVGAMTITDFEERMDRRLGKMVDDKVSMG